MEYTLTPIGKALCKLDALCCKYKIEYAVTGTTALDILGLPSRLYPQDIDIKVFHLTEEQAERLQELQFLAGLNTKDYPTSKCYSFIINGFKINAIADPANYDEMATSNVTIDILDLEVAKHRSISVQRVKYALADKMKLGRKKDSHYMWDLINILTSKENITNTL